MLQLVVQLVMVLLMVYRDSSGQQTQYIFPTVVDRDNLSNTFTFITGSILPQGDLFPVFLNTGIHNAKFTDVHVSYNDPTNVHPFQLFTDHQVEVMWVQMNGIIGTVVYMLLLLYMIQTTYIHW